MKIKFLTVPVIAVVWWCALAEAQSPKLDPARNHPFAAQSVFSRLRGVNSRAISPYTTGPGRKLFVPLSGYGPGFPDITFGTSGFAEPTNSGSSFNDLAGHSLAIQTDGKIVVAAYAVGPSANSVFLVARFNPDGTIDNSFGTSGFVNTFISGGDSVDDKGYSVAVQSDGKIVVAGYSSGNGLTDRAFAVARFNSDGTLDNTFGTNGTARAFTNGCTQLSVGQSVAIQRDGKIVVAGYCDDDITKIEFFGVARWNSHGTIDTTFGSKGTARVSISGGKGVEDRGYSVALQPDGKIVMAGYSRDASMIYGFAVARFDTDGVLDPTFGTLGSFRSPISTGRNTDDVGNSVAIQSDGKIVVGGWSRDTHGYADEIERFNSDGTMDNAFGTNGSRRMNISGGDGSDDEINSVVIQRDGKIVGAGWSEVNPYLYFALARLNSDGTTDTTFGTKGSTRVDVKSQCYSAAIQPDGKIDVGGYDGGVVVGRFLAAPSSVVTSVKNADWNDESTWLGGVVPSPTDTVAIMPEDTVTIDASISAVCKSLYIAGVLQFPDPSTTNLMVSGNLNVESTGTLQPAAAANNYGVNWIYVGGDLTVDGNFIGRVSGTSSRLLAIDMNGSSAAHISGAAPSVDFSGYLEIDALKTGVSVTLDRPVDVSGTFVKPESEPTITEIANLLQQDPSVKLFVVGHTDNVGELTYNMKLSQDRADAVVRALVTKHGIGQSRLKAFGVGPLSPVATNETEDGRAKNRRVELVKQ